MKPRSSGPRGPGGGPADLFWTWVRLGVGAGIVLGMAGYGWALFAAAAAPLAAVGLARVAAFLFAPAESAGA